jgi:hypothetical protein
LIDLGLSRGRNAMAIWQHLVDAAASRLAIRALSDSFTSCAARQRAKHAP